MLAHPVNKRNRWWQFIAFGLVIGLTPDLYSQEEAVETAPAFQAPQLSPSLGDFVTGMPLAKKLKMLFTKKLLKEPFAGAPIDGVKGLASKIKAGQVDAKNRVVAIKFLGTVDCAAYPDAQVMLIIIPSLSPVQRDLTQVQKELILLYEQKGLNPPPKLTLPSLDLDPTPPFGESADVVPAGVVPGDVTSSVETEERLHVLSTLVRIGDRKPVHSAKESKQLFRPRFIQVSAESHATATNEKHVVPLKCVRGYCVVALSKEKLIKGLPEFSSVYDGHTYYFSTDKAKELFDVEPARFAPVMAGADPVLLKQTGQMQQGNYIWRHDDRFYFFVTKENRSDFLKSPEFYALSSRE